jgi:hypothetical protein
MPTKSERICEILRGLRHGTPEVIGAAVVSSEGFIVASVIPNEVDEDLIGGMAASLLGVGERISADRIQRGEAWADLPRGQTHHRRVDEVHMNARAGDQDGARGSAEINRRIWTEP